jgi:hypothetical protein
MRVQLEHRSIRRLRGLETSLGSVDVAKAKTRVDVLRL